MIICLISLIVINLKQPRYLCRRLASTFLSVGLSLLIVVGLDRWVKLGGLIDRFNLPLTPGLTNMSVQLTEAMTKPLADRLLWPGVGLVVLAVGMYVISWRLKKKD
ncbi:MAG: hypothetical protein CEN88_205 [Candidatus Berkelbacteria bacterium Licking1014_2]|uniref:Uncharacterized protein n=1 Tax=Candidatus Berkelbacteria bacterium Licking1014_2 TaxID=2017146 RepID=A0A554LW20_9BACT|nr:MAG: hypothetical protein CEN88_205 [Candidatus Berkelbacteria bacterium Licking1014_2]